MLTDQHTSLRFEADHIALKAPLSLGDMPIASSSTLQLPSGPLTISSPLTPGPTPLSSPRDHLLIECGGVGTSDGVNTLLDAFDLLDTAQKKAFLHRVLTGVRVRPQFQNGWPDLGAPDVRLSSTLLLGISSILRPLLKRDFLACLPTELALAILSNIDDVKTLVRCGGVSKAWRKLVLDEGVWKRMCQREGFFHGIGGTPILLDNVPPPDPARLQSKKGLSSAKMLKQDAVDKEILQSDECQGDETALVGPPSNSMRLEMKKFHGQASYRDVFRSAYLTEQAWLRGGVLKASHQSITQALLRGSRRQSLGTSRLLDADFTGGIVTSLSMDGELAAVGMNNRKIHVFSVESGALHTTLTGHSGEVWCLALISRTVERDMSLPDERMAAENAEAHSQSSSGAAIGFGNEEPLLISGGCDKNLRLWNPIQGTFIRLFEGHSSTVRCIKVINQRPIAVSGSRDGTLRVWNLDSGALLHTLIGHSNSVRCIEAKGNVIVSGSYDTTAKVWNIDTGVCLHTLHGHYQHIYAVAFDGVKIVTGSLDSCVSIWSAATGERLAVLQGHTSLVGQLQLWRDVLVTGGSDGTLRVWALSKKAVKRLGRGRQQGLGVEGLRPGFRYERFERRDQVDSSAEPSEPPTNEVVYVCIHHIAAHDHSLTSLSFDQRRIISGGNDGRVKMWDLQTGAMIRELIKPPAADAIWRVGTYNDKVIILTKRGEETGMDLISFQAQDVERLDM